MPEVTPTMMNNDGTALGIGLGVSLSIIFVLIVGTIIIGVAICVYVKRGSSKRYAL